jgi:hypothetical protein
MSQQIPDTIRVNCGELCTTNKCTASEINLLHTDIGDLTPNITINYERFIKNPDDLPEKILDLLQIAAYVFCADRMAKRGSRESVNYGSWARSFEFHVPVLDLEFWNNPKTQEHLNDALTFISGDRSYAFVFSQTSSNPAGTKNKQLSMFPGEYQNIGETKETDIMLFSGGLDSLAGAIQRLNEYTDRSICFVSHESNNTVTHTQKGLISALEKTYGKRVKQYRFQCCNRAHVSSKDETQRTRMFLFSAIAFSLCNCYNKHEFYVYENGITSLNFSKQADVLNGRASRTTHPKTLGLLRRFYKLIDPSFDIIAPYYNQTKAEVLKVFATYDEKDLITSAVSCSSSRTKSEHFSHCGCCSQCVDRRFSLYAADLQEYDAGYANDFIFAFPDDNKEIKQRIYTTMYLARREEISTFDAFIKKYPSDIMDITEYWPNSSNADDSADEVYDLICRYGDSVLAAATKMRNKYDDLKKPINQDSLLGIIASRQYEQRPFSRRVEEIDAILNRVLPATFQREKPKNENDFNDKLEGLLKVRGEFSREYPVLQFGLSAYKADHAQGDLLIESKYIRKNTPPSKASEGIAADVTKIPDGYGILFVVYDPEHQIANDDVFIKSFEYKRNNCYVRIYR